MLGTLSDPQFWLGLGQITLINVVLSADNAIVIALAARSLPARQQKQALVYGTRAVVAVRIALTLLAAELLKWPYLKIIGAILLFWIAKLMEKWPIIITIGAGLLGWVAGEMLVTDPAWAEWISANLAWLHVHLWKLDFSWVQMAGAAFVVLLGKRLAKGKDSDDGAKHKVVDLAAGDQQNLSSK